MRMNEQEKNDRIDMIARIAGMCDYLESCGCILAGGETAESDNVVDEVTQERLDKLEAFDSNMRLVRRLDEAERARDKVFKDAATQLAEAKERYQALQASKDLLGMEKARLNQKYYQAIGMLEATRDKLAKLQGHVEDGKSILLAAGVAGIAFSALVYILS